MGTAIRLEHVSKVFPGGDGAAVEGLSLEIPEGETVVLVGPSGCGKTTTLKMINRLIEPTSGRIVVGDREIRDLPAHELRRGIGYVIQQIGLFPHRNIADNIATVPRLLGWGKDRIHKRVSELVELVGLRPDMLRRYPAELSGGQQQRVGVARALAADPPVLLMDEPFGAVDPIVRNHLQDQLLQLQAELHKTIVLVTHDIDEAIKLGQRIALLNVGGILEQYGPPDEILAEPANDFVRQFLGRERGLKRLSLIPVSRIKLDRGPVVGPSASVDEAVEVMMQHGVDWVAVVDGRTLFGWVGSAELEGCATVGGVTPHPFAVRVCPESSMREALDAVVTSQHRVAIVSAGDEFLGMLTMARISEEIAG